MSEGKVLTRIGKMEQFQPRPARIFSPEVCAFLSELSVSLLSDKNLRAYPDVISFAYWCRKANIAAWKAKYDTETIRVGRGTAFHIAPSNVPVNSFFSYAFSLLAGNVNIVRLPSKDTPQTDAVCAHLNKLLPDYPDIQPGTVFVQYERSDVTTADFSRMCDVRIIWGGDQTVANIRSISLPPRSVEILFPDRYSLCVLGTNAVSALDGADLAKLAKSFYNDAYIMDQNACSSPHVIVWLGGYIDDVSRRFWGAVYETAKSIYDLQPAHASDKYLDACLNAAERTDIERLIRYDNYTYIYKLSHLPESLETARGRYGAFFEANIQTLDTLARTVSEKCQTMTYFGVDKQMLTQFVLQTMPRGIDRIVPVGKALDISLTWDGYDLISAMSRIVDIR